MADIDNAAETPLLDLLRNVPTDARVVYEHNPTHHQYIPAGRLCAEAAAEIEKLRAERDALLYQFNELMLEVWHQLGMREEYQETDDVKAHENRCRALLGDAALASGAKDE